MTEDEIIEAKKDIDSMTVISMASIWRFSSGHPYLSRDNGDLPDYFQNRFFKELGGFTPEISKELGW